MITVSQPITQIFVGWVINIWVDDDNDSLTETTQPQWNEQWMNSCQQLQSKSLTRVCLCHGQLDSQCVSKVVLFETLSFQVGAVYASTCVSNLQGHVWFFEWNGMDWAVPEVEQHIWKSGEGPPCHHDLLYWSSWLGMQHLLAHCVWENTLLGKSKHGHKWSCQMINHKWQLINDNGSSSSSDKWLYVDGDWWIQTLSRTWNDQDYLNNHSQNTMHVLWWICGISTCLQRVPNQPFILS